MKKEVIKLKEELSKKEGEWERENGELDQRMGTFEQKEEKQKKKDRIRKTGIEPKIEKAYKVGKIAQGDLENWTNKKYLWKTKIN